jgi:hypothetical protein
MIMNVGQKPDLTQLTIIDNFRGEISQMREILGFKFLKRLILIKIIFKKIKKFSPHIKLKKHKCYIIGHLFYRKKTSAKRILPPNSMAKYPIRLEFFKSAFL